MKKLFIWVLAGTMILAASCQREQLANSTAQDGVKEVTTQFVLNVAAKSQTKQSADVVQQNQNFRGMQNVKLMCYKTGMAVEDHTVVPYVLSTTAPEATDVKEFDLGILMAEGYIDNEDDHNKENSSNRVLQLSIPVGVDAVLFYGKANKPDNGQDAVYGCTYDYNFRDPNKKSTISTTPSQTQFYALPMLNETTTPSYDATGAVMIAVINDLIQTSVEETESAKFGPTGAQVEFKNLPAVAWSDYGHKYEIDKLGEKSRYTNQTTIDHKLVGLEEILGQCYFLFTYINPSDVPSNLQPGSEEWKNYINQHIGQVSPLGEYRSGSSFAMKKMVADMYKVIYAASVAIPTTPDEANACRLAKVVLSRATSFFDVNSGGDYLSVDVIKTVLGTKWNAAWDGKIADLNNYPGYFDIPQGAAQLGFTKQTTSTTVDYFYYYHPNHPLVNPTMTEFEPRKYLYPAELWYYVNSPIRTTSKDVLVSDYPNGVTPWNTDASWEAKEWVANSAVSSATRGVAVKHDINYGVALLKSIVTTSGDLYDNRAAKTDETTNKKVDKSKIKLTGVLVGGVNPRMNWQFTRYYTQSGTPTTESDLSLFDGVIFDSETGNKSINSEIVNYTLVYDNYNSTGTSGTGLQSDQNDVFISLEFKNEGDAFWGRDNMIPMGGTFYLVGKVSKPSVTQIENLSWPTDHQIPPVYGVDNETVPEGNYKGESKKIARVFIQDFTTTVNFTLNGESLRHAYYSVPDLRASQMSLGLSVDVKWNSGLDYNVVL